MSRLSRRDFLKGAAAFTASWTLAPCIKAMGVNNDIRVAVVGVRGMGKSHVRNYLKMTDVRLVALCDADLAILNAEVRQLDKSGVKVAAYQDIRKLFESKEVDAISIVTPDHWHALATIWGCQAGKDIDVEKPVSHNIWEGRKMVEAARKYHRIVQADLDARSRTTYDEAFEYLHSGALGRIVLGRGFCYKLRPSIGLMQGAGVIPKTVDYDLWCGPAPNGPLNRTNLHYDWHWAWDTGGGELAGNGVHQLDAIRWMFKEPGLPRRVMSFGGRLGYQDDGQTPNVQITFFDYPTAPIIYETRGLPSAPGAKLMDVYDALAATGVHIKSKHTPSVAHSDVIIQCEHGYVELGVGAAFDNGGKKVKQFTHEGSLDPQANFIKAVRSRKLSDIKTDIPEGHISTALCHMGNISYRIGQKAKPGEILERLRGDKDGLEAFGRFREHLGVHSVDLERTSVTLGPWLSMDAKSEHFTGPHAEQANADLLMKRAFRRPYVVPEQV